VKLNRTLLMIGYGSLLSGYGMLAERRGGGSRLIARDGFPLKLANARRGLAKPSSHGRYLAMDLEPIKENLPMVAHRVDGAGVDGIGVLGLEFDREWAPMIARREEYDPGKFLELIELADSAGKPLGEFLLQIAERTRFNLLAYRTALRELIGYTSHGYIFHPIPFADGRVGIAAIGSGFDGSGDPAIQSKRREYAMDRLLPLAQALEVKILELDREGQIGYFVECLVGAIHGLGIADLGDGLVDESELAKGLALKIAATLPRERALFMQATSLDEHRYRRAFAPELDRRLRHLFPEIAG
jgi:hypothetical protein